MSYLYFNIHGNQTDAFLGTVAVKFTPGHKIPPATRAKELACSILGADGAPGGIRAVSSTKQLFSAYKLHDIQDDN